MEEIYFDNENKLCATVSGQDEYTIIIDQENSAINGQCSCPYDGGDVCKHIVSVLFFALNDYDKIKIKKSNQNKNKTSPSSGDFEAYLNTLSKEELIRMLKDYAPKNFRKQIENTFLSETDTDALFWKTITAINKILKDDELLYSAYSFEDALVAKLEKLRGIWGKKPDKISDLLLDTLQKINDVQDEGYLYSENYNGGWGSEEYFEGDDLKNYMIDFIKQLPIEKRLDFVQNVIKLTEKFGYDSAVCHISKELHTFFSDSELPHLKKYYLSLVQNGNYYNEEEYYKRLSSVFSEEEKEFVLKKTSVSSAELTSTLAKFYEDKNRITNAVSVLDDFISKHKSSNYCPKDIFLLRLQYGTQQNEPSENLSSLAKQGLSLHPDSQMLKSILSFLPEYNVLLEELLKTKNSYEIFKYYESNNRLNEAVALIKGKKIGEYESYLFWCRHKQLFKQEAQEAFEERIVKNLTETKDSAYQTVTDTLIQLRQIAPDVFTHWLNEIKTRYSRRRNLMQMLQKL